MDELGNRDKREVGRRANNRVENSHLSFPRRERTMLRSRRIKSLQKFASVHANVHNHFQVQYRKRLANIWAKPVSSPIRPHKIRLLETEPLYCQVILPG